MPRVPITVMGYRCLRCEHEWIPRGDADQEPKVCPKCKSPYWDKERRQSPATSYEHFKSAVEAALKDFPEGLTWTQIRTGAKLPQKLPNNGWVRLLESQIGLKRVREHGVILWKLVGGD